MVMICVWVLYVHLPFGLITETTYNWQTAEQSYQNYYGSITAKLKWYVLWSISNAYEHKWWHLHALNFNFETADFPFDCIMMHLKLELKLSMQLSAIP